MSDPIVIDHDTLQRLSNLWSQRQHDAEDRQKPFTWDDGAHGDLGIAWVTKLGVDGYLRGKEMSGSIEDIRSNLADRIKKFGDHAYELHWGLDNLMRNSEACEHFNQMTADGFNAAFPQAGG